MSILSAVFYGILQGATEFLPVSSSGHLSLAQHFFGAQNPEMDYLLFDILLHLGTLAAVFIVYFQDIRLLAVEFFCLLGDILKGKGADMHNPHRKMGVMIVLSTLPLFLILPVKDQIEGLYSNTVVVGAALMVTGFMLWFVDRQNQKKTIDIKRAPMGVSLIIGLFQAIATLPGISRSGATITGGVLCGFNRELAVKYSFLMSIPAILGANILSLKDLQEIDGGLILPFFMGALAAAVTGFFAIRLIIYLARRKKFGFFSGYCVIVGLLAIIATIVLK